LPPLICLMAAGILMLAERYYWVLGILGGMAVYLGAFARGADERWSRNGGRWKVDFPPGCCC